MVNEYRSGPRMFNTIEEAQELIRCQRIDEYKIVSGDVKECK